MPDLEKNSLIAENRTMQSRIIAAIRLTAPAKLADRGASKALAERVMQAPDAAATVAAHFLMRTAANADVADAACKDCGHSPVDDGTILWIVGDQWDDVAAIVTPVPAA